MESLKTQQTESCKMDFTQGEKDLAARHKVEPKLCRLLDDLIEEKLAGQSKPQQPEEIEAPEELQESTELTISEETQERIVKYFKSLEPRAKLAILTLSEIKYLDGMNFQFKKGTEERLYDRIENDLESVCLETFNSKQGKVPDTALGAINSIARIGEIDEDSWLNGIWQACRMINQNC